MFSVVTAIVLNLSVSVVIVIMVHDVVLGHVVHIILRTQCSPVVICCCCWWFCLRLLFLFDVVVVVVDVVVVVVVTICINAVCWQSFLSLLQTLIRFFKSTDS